MASSPRYALWPVVMLVALLVATAPAAAATNTALGSIHTTNTEFNNATTLANVTVSGGNVNAQFDDTYEISSASFSRSINSQDSIPRGIAWNNNGTKLYEVGQDSDNVYEYDVSTPFNISTASFSQSISVTNPTGIAWNDDGTKLYVVTLGTSIREYEVSTPYDISTATFARSISTQDATPMGIVWNSDGSKLYEVGDGSNEIYEYDVSTPFNVSTASFSTNISTQDSTPTGIAWNDDGSYLYEVGDNGNNIYEYEVSTPYDISTASFSTSINTQDTSPQGIAWNDDGTKLYEVGNQDDNIYEYDVDDSIGTATYVSANHSVDNVVNGFTNLTLTDSNATVIWQEHTGGSWSDIRTDTYTTSGNKSVDITSATSSDIRVNVTFDDTGHDAVGQLHDEGVTFTNHDPEFDNSTASPSGGTTLSSSPVTFSIQLNDTEFGLSQGDSVDVEFFVNGSSVGTNNSITANGTVEFEYTPTVGGDRQWHAEATDSYGGTNTSDTFDFTVPAQLQIREEESPHTLIKSATATVTFYENVEDSPTIVQRTTTDGNISLSGLPVNSEFVVSIGASGYHNRTVIISDIFEQADVFLINRSKTTTVNNTFTLDDATGDFSAEDGVSFFIQKAINQSEYDTGGFDWLTVSGDNLGGQQFFIDDLEQEGRYRLRIENDAGDTRILGEYVAEDSGTVTLAVGSVNITPTEGSTYAWNATFNDSGSNFIRFSFNDTDDGTTDLDVTVYEWGNESNVLATDLDNAGAFGTFSFSQQLTGDDVSKTWVVEWNATKDGSAIGGSEVVGREVIGPTLPLDTVWLEVGSVGALVLIAGAVGGLINPAVGALVLAMVGGVLWQLGFMPAEIGGGAIVLAFLVAASWLVFQNRSEP